MSALDVVNLAIEGPKLLRPKVFPDARGFFLESYSEERMRALGLGAHFVQDNHSRSCRNTLRGLHFQQASSAGPGQAKLVRVASGAIFDVVVDVRLGSPTFGRWVSVLLDSDRHEQLYIPVGFAHGFCVLSDVADVLYKVSSPYNAASEKGFAFDDAAVGVAWPISRSDAILSGRDQSAASFDDVKPLFSADPARSDP